MYQQNFKQTFPKIIGIGKNYLKHVIQLGGKQIPKQPIVFFKPWDCVKYCPNSITFAKPQHLTWHQVQLAVLIGQKGIKIKQEDAMKHIKAYAVALDITDKTKDLCYCLCKGQIDFCPIGNFIQTKQINDPYSLKLKLTINGKVVQQDITGQMHFKIDKLISYVSQYLPLNEGDVILTGTPDGTGPIKKEDQVIGQLINGQQVVSQLHFTVQ